jgi:hypothetical protein
MDLHPPLPQAARIPNLRSAWKHVVNANVEQQLNHFTGAGGKSVTDEALLRPSLFCANGACSWALLYAHTVAVYNLGSCPIGVQGVVSWSHD